MGVSWAKIKWDLDSHQHQSTLAQWRLLAKRQHNLAASTLKFANKHYLQRGEGSDENDISFTDYLNFNKKKYKWNKRKDIKAMKYWKKPERRGHRQLMNGRIEWHKELHLPPGIKPLRHWWQWHCYLRPARQETLWPHLQDNQLTCAECVWLMCEASQNGDKLKACLWLFFWAL